MRFGIVLLIIVCCVSCQSKKVPDVSGVQVDLEVERFDQDLFAIDTSHVDEEMQRLHQKYPHFVQDFIYNILALPPQPDSQKVVEKNIIAFINSYKSVKSTTDKSFGDFGSIEKEVKRGLQFVKYYFPDYKVPNKIITFIGPINSFGNILTVDGIGVGLQLYLGKDYPLYSTPAMQELYPGYISRRFESAYIPVNCIKNIIDDMYPENASGKPLIEQMIAAGKKLYLLDHLLPFTADTLKTGYTGKQLAGCYENERIIWSYFAKNELLYESDPSLTRDYMNDAPMTQAFGNESPGSIGQFTGWQIVKKWMDKHEDKSLKDLMNTDNKTVFEEARYKP